MPVSRLRWIIVAAAVLPFLAGVAGPFVLDDHVNLAPAWQWLAGQRDFFDTLFGNRSGPSGRPLAYLTLMANAWFGGSDPLGFKLVNLALHAACALMVFELLRRVLALAAPERGAMAAAALAVLWAVHPMQASTVLYVVQRMALLGAIAQLAAVLAYLEGRRHLEQDPRRARIWLFAVFPTVLLAGLLAKETVLVAPLACAVIEFVVFAGRERRREVFVFHAAFLLLPALAGLAWGMATQRFDASYAGREFTLVQRLLTEPFVLLEYAAHWAWPAQLGLYRDGHAVTTQPWGIAVIVAAAAGAALLRRRAPLVAFGVLWFLAGHALEAGPFALEIYFEHRNYLPSLGLLVAAYGLLPARLATRAHGALFVVAGLLAVLAAQRSWQWNDLDRLLASEGPPAGEISRRLQVDRAIRATQRGDGEARAAAIAVLAQGTPGDRAAAAAWTAIFACDADGGLAAAQREALVATPPAVLTHNHLSWLSILARRAVDGRCPGLGKDDMRNVLEAWEDAARKPLSRRAVRQLPALRAQLDGGSS